MTLMDDQLSGEVAGGEDLTWERPIWSFSTVIELDVILYEPSMNGY